jgi:hypothetical protein
MSFSDSESTEVIVQFVDRLKPLSSVEIHAEMCTNDEFTKLVKKTVAA